MTQISAISHHEKAPIFIREFNVRFHLIYCFLGEIMNKFRQTVLTIFIWFTSFTLIYADDHTSVNASVIIPKKEVDATLLEGLSRIAGDRSISDIVVRHIDVGEEYLGVSVVQRTKLKLVTLRLVSPILLSMRFTIS